MLEENKYLVRKKIFNWMGEEFEVFDSKENVVLFGKQKAFRLKEELKVFSSSKKDDELFTIQARRILDFSTTYDVTDSKTGKKIGALQRKGFQSILKDEWHILNNEDQQVGKILEDNMTLALLRRLFMNLIPQKYSVFYNEVEVCDYTQHFNPFIFKMDVEFKAEGMDKRLGLAGAILLSLIEGRQE